MINILGCKTPVKPMYFELDITDPPPVLMLAINPNDFNKTFAKKVTSSRNRPSTRDAGAYIYNFDFDELDTMNCSGTSALFYSENGLTTAGRISSLGYRNFKSLIEVYRNNGRNYNLNVMQGAPLVTGGTGLIKTVGRVIIAYDDFIYRGSFDSFSVSEVDQKPFNLSFNFQFVVSRTIDVRNP